MFKSIKIALFSVLTVCITVVMFCIGANAADPALSIGAHNVSFGVNTYLLYAVKAENVSVPADVKLLVSETDQGDFVKGDEDYLLTTVGRSKIGGVYHQVYQFTDLSAKQFIDDYYVRAWINVDGVDYYSPLDKYSIMRYTYNKIGKTGTASTDENLIGMLNALMEYAAWSQKYFKYKTDTLATDTFSLVKAIGATLPDGFGDGLLKSGTSLTLTANAPAAGKVFDHWEDSKGNDVGFLPVLTVTVGDENETYTAVFEDAQLYSEGLVYTSRGDGTTVVTGIGTCTDTELKIPKIAPNGDVVTTVGSAAFKECSFIQAVTIPASVTTVEEEAFSGCAALQTVNFGKGVSSIGICVIEDSLNVVQLTVTAGNATFVAVDNCVINRTNGTLVLGCATSVIPTDGSVTAIGDYAFATKTIYMPSVSIGGGAGSYPAIGPETVVIPDSVTIIGSHAFTSCHALSSLTIGTGVVSIGNKAFSSCSSLKEVTYTGTIAQWNSISKGSSIGNFTVHCSDGDI